MKLIPSTRTGLAVVSAAGLAVAAASSVGGYALAASTTATAPATNIYGCVAGSGRTLEGVYTVAGNFKTCPAGSFAVTVASGAKGATGATGPQGPAGTPIDYASTGNNTPYLAIDQAPGPDGSGGTGGWGWDQTANKPVTSLQVGTDAPFTVTAIQPGSGSHGTGDFTVTLTYDPYDFQLVSASGVGTPISMGDANGTVSYPVSNNGHTDLSVGFVFKPLHANPDASIGVTVTSDANGQATGTYPVQITG